MKKCKPFAPGTVSVVDPKTRTIVPRLVTKRERFVGSLRRTVGREPSGKAIGEIGYLSGVGTTVIPLQTRADLRRLSQRSGQAMIRLLNAALEEFFVKYRVPSKALFAYRKRRRIERKIAQERVEQNAVQ